MRRSHCISCLLGLQSPRASVPRISEQVEIKTVQNQPAVLYDVIGSIFHVGDNYTRSSLEDDTSGHYVTIWRNPVEPSKWIRIDNERLINESTETINERIAKRRGGMQPRVV